MEHSENKYAFSIQLIANIVGGLIVWKTKKGDVNKQMYKVLGISRPSHLAYLKNEQIVPSYIWNQIDLLINMEPNRLISHAFKLLVDTDKLTTRECLDLAIRGWELVSNRDFPVISGSDFAGKFSVNTANKLMAENLKIDSSGITTGLMLQNNLANISTSLEYNLSEITNPNDLLKQQLIGLILANLYISDTPLGAAISTFKNTCHKAISFYKPHFVPSECFLNSSVDIMNNAKKTFNYLSRFQLGTSLQQIDPVRLKIQEQIYVFDSVSELVENSLIPQGFSINLIKTSRLADSFFCLLVKSSKGTYLLTDRPPYSELDKDCMASRNQRYNVMRLEDSYFPYELMHFVTRDNERDLKVSKSRKLTTTEELPILGHFRDMTNESILWFTFLFEECQKYFFNNDSLSVPLLSYINKTTIKHHLNHNKNDTQLPTEFIANGTIKIKSFTELDKLTTRTKDINSSLLDDRFWVNKIVSPKVDDSLLYIPETQAKLIVIENKLTGLFTAEKTKINDNELKSGFTLKQIPLSLIGTKESVQNEVDSLAVFNKSTIVAKILNQDYNERMESINQWLSRKIKQNLSVLVDHLVSLDHEYFFIGKKLSDLAKHPKNQNNNTLVPRQIHVEKMTPLYDFRVPFTSLHKVLKLRDSKNNAKCAMTKKMHPYYSFFLNISCIYDLEKITGLSRNKLPIELRNWGLKSNKNQGFINTPWDYFSFSFAINLDCTFANQRRKILGLKKTNLLTKNYYEDQEMFDFLKNHPSLDDNIILQAKVDYKRPRFAFLTK